MNLIGEEDSGPQFFSPGRIQRARDLQNEKEAHAQAERERIAKKKVQVVVNKAQNEAAKAEQTLQAEARHQLITEEKLRKAECYGGPHNAITPDVIRLRGWPCVTFRCYGALNAKKPAT